MAEPASAARLEPRLVPGLAHGTRTPGERSHPHPRCYSEAYPSPAIRGSASTPRPRTGGPCVVRHPDLPTSPARPGTGTGPIYYLGS